MAPPICLSEKHHIKEREVFEMRWYGFLYGSDESKIVNEIHLQIRPIEL